MADKRNVGNADVHAHNERHERLARFEKWGEKMVIRIDYEKLVGSEKWNQYMEDYQSICNTLNEMYKLQKEIKSAVVDEVKKYSN